MSEKLFNINSFSKKKKLLFIILVVSVALIICLPFILRAVVSFGNWHEINEINGVAEASSGKTKFYSNGNWIESFGDNSGHDGEWEILSDFTFVYDDGYDVTYYNCGDWFYIGTDLFLGDDYHFSRLPFLYPGD